MPVIAADPVIAAVQVTGATYAALLLAGFLIGLSKGGLGGAFAAFLAAVVALTIPADVTLGVLLPMTIIGDWLAFGAVRGEWNLSIVKKLLPGALIGIAIGSLVLSTISESGLRRLMAGIVIMFFVWRTVQRRRSNLGEMGTQERTLPAWLGWLAGAGGGFGSTVATIGSPPIVMYLLATNVAPRTFVATSAAFFPAVNLIKTPGYFAAGVVDIPLIVATSWTWIAIPVGVFFGRKLISRIQPGVFEKLTMWLMLGGAALLLIRA